MSTKRVSANDGAASTEHAEVSTEHLVGTTKLG